MAFRALAIQLRRQIQHHLLQKLGIFREMFDADRHVSKCFFNQRTHLLTIYQAKTNDFRNVLCGTLISLAALGLAQIDSAQQGPPHSCAVISRRCSSALPDSGIA
jgi:hypothetical protein